MAPGSEFLPSTIDEVHPAHHWIVATAENVAPGLWISEKPLGMADQPIAWHHSVEEFPTSQANSGPLIIALGRRGENVDYVDIAYPLVHGRICLGGGTYPDTLGVAGIASFSAGGPWMLGYNPDVSTLTASVYLSPAGILDWSLTEAGDRFEHIAQPAAALALRYFDGPPCQAVSVVRNTAAELSKELGVSDLQDRAVAPIAARYTEIC